MMQNDRPLAVLADVLVLLLKLNLISPYVLHVSVLSDRRDVGH